MLAPQTLTRAEQEALLQAVTQPRDHMIFSLALGTGLRLAEVVGLNVGDVPQAMVLLTRNKTRKNRIIFDQLNVQAFSCGRGGTDQ